MITKNKGCPISDTLYEFTVQNMNLSILSAEGQYTWIMPDCQLRYNDFSLTIFSLVRKLAESPAESVASVPVSVLFPNG